MTLLPTNTCSDRRPQYESCCGWHLLDDAMAMVGQLKCDSGACHLRRNQFVFSFVIFDHLQHDSIPHHYGAGIIILGAPCNKFLVRVHARRERSSPPLEIAMLGQNSLATTRDFDGARVVVLGTCFDELLVVVDSWAECCPPASEVAMLVKIDLAPALAPPPLNAHALLLGLDELWNNVVGSASFFCYFATVDDLAAGLPLHSACAVLLGLEELWINGVGSASFFGYFATVDEVAAGPMTVDDLPYTAVPAFGVGGGERGFWHDL